MSLVFFCVMLYDKANICTLLLRETEVSCNLNVWVRWVQTTYVCMYVCMCVFVSTVACAEGSMLGSFVFDKLKDKEKRKEPPKITLIK